MQLCMSCAVTRNGDWGIRLGQGPGLKAPSLLRALSCSATGVWARRHVLASTFFGTHFRILLVIPAVRYP